MADRDAVLLSCGIFRQELEYLLRKRGSRREVVFLDAALHVNFAKLEARLARALEEARSAGKAAVVLYGRCHPRMDEIVARFGAERLEAGNCLEAIVGQAELRRLEGQGKTFFLSVGWVNHWEEMFGAGEADLGIDFRQSFAGYRRALVLDTGLLPVDEGKVAAFSAFTGLPVERLGVTLDHLEGLLAGHWGEEGGGR